MEVRGRPSHPVKHAIFLCCIRDPPPPNSNKGPKKGYYKPLCTNPPHKKSLEKFVAFSPHNKHSQYFKRISRFPFGAVVGLCSVKGAQSFCFFLCYSFCARIDFSSYLDTAQGGTARRNSKSQGKKKRHSLPVHPCCHVSLVPQYYSCVSVVFS